MMGGQQQRGGGGAGASSAAASVAKAAMGGASRPSQEVDPFAPERRKQLQAARLAKEEAAVAAKVQQVQDAQAGLDEDRETERGLEKSLKLKVAQWQKDKKNLRALLQLEGRRHGRAYRPEEGEEVVPQGLPRRAP